VREEVKVLKHHPQASSILGERLAHQATIIDGLFAPEQLALVGSLE
jgi:hypothetical protein